MMDQRTYIHTYYCVYNEYMSVEVRGGIDTFLVRPTSRSRIMQSIVSLESVVGTCAELQVFPSYRC
jgi:hypothetical protein